MTRTIKAYLIDAEKREVTEVETEPTFEAYYALLGCSTIERVYIEGVDHLVWIDEEGLLRDPEHFFVVNGAEPILPTKGLVVAFDQAEPDDDLSVRITIESMRRNVLFPDVEFCGLETSEGEVEIGGMKAFSITTVPVFKKREPAT